MNINSIWVRFCPHVKKTNKKNPDRPLNESLVRIAIATAYRRLSCTSSSLDVHRGLFHISCIFITEDKPTHKPAVGSLLKLRGRLTQTVTNALTKEERTGQSHAVSTTKVTTNVWDKHEDKWDRNQISSRNIPTLHLIDMFFCHSCCLGCFILIYSNYEEHSFWTTCNSKQLWRIYSSYQ